MSSVWLALRADLSHRWRAMVGLALLLGLIGGVVLVAAAGARRTDTAYPRLLNWASAAELTVVPGDQGLATNGTGRTGFYQALARLPQVASLSTVALFGMAIPVPHGPPDLNVNAFGSLDGSLGVTADRVKVIAGRLFNPADPGAAMVDPRLAVREHLRPGSVLHLLGIPHYTTRPDMAHAVRLTLRVSAIVRFDDQIVPANTATAMPQVLLTPAFSGEAAVRPFTGGDYAGVRLRPGASRASFVRAATALAKRYPDTRGRLGIRSNSDQVAVTERAIAPEVIALVVFAALAGVIGLAVVGQLLTRQLLMDAAEFPVLRALGMTRATLATLSLARAGVVTIGGAGIAVAVAIAASPLMPIGPARLAEPNPGVEVNLAILGGGIVAIALLPLALLAPVAWWAARAGSPLGVAEPPVPAGASSLSRSLSVAGSATGGIGVRMAFEPGRGRTAVPVRSALAATTVAVAAVVAALVFGTSLVSLTTSPHRYGQDWAQEVDFTVPAAPRALTASVMAGQSQVRDYALGVYGSVTVAGHAVSAIGIDPVRGSGFLNMLSGRPTAGPGEIALGERTMRALHLRVGERVPVTVHGRSFRLRIVGEPVFASFSEGGDTATDLGQGAEVPASLLSAAYAPAFAPIGCRRGALTCYSFILVRYAPGTWLPAADARLEKALAKAGCASCASVITDQRPRDIRDYAGVRDTPLALSAVLALLAIGALTHVLITSVRRRRRDLAMLKTLGLTRRQVLSVVRWQASALATVALVLGLPLGIVAGRWSWAAFASSLGVSGGATIPVLPVLLAVPVMLLIANLIAAGPGRTAARLRPAAVLRSD
jgi:putative ABC transport system permease protein